MHNRAYCLAMVLLTTSASWCAEEPEGLLNRFLAKMKTELGRLPDYVCSQTVERLARVSAERPWERVDTLNLEVAMIGDKEFFAKTGTGQLQDRPLFDIVGKGTVATGQLGLLARHVFLGSRATFTYRGDVEVNGRRAHEYDYDVPADKSKYLLRTSKGESAVAFQGSFRFDGATTDLLSLEVQAYDIPEKLGLAEANTILSYARVEIHETEVLLPVSAKLTVAALDGTEDLNRTRIEGCRHYRSLAEVRFDETPGETVPEVTPATIEPDRPLITKGTFLEIALDEDLDPSAANVGDPVKARLSKPLKEGERVTVPSGVIVMGRLARIASEAMPFPMWEVALEIDTLEMEDRKVPLAATMAEAGPAAGLLRQAKRLDPTFTKQRTARMDILVREVARGQGILHWDARRGPMRRGLRMKWRVEEDVR